MKLLKTGLLALCVIGLATSCASYRTCPAYAQQPQEDVYKPDFSTQLSKVEKVRSL